MDGNDDELMNDDGSVRARARQRVNHSKVLFVVLHYQGLIF